MLNFNQFYLILKLRAASFRLPDDKNSPIILVGSGTGIAPFRSFWQERKIDMQTHSLLDEGEKKGWGPMILYFGCRQPSVDELYKDEICQLLNENVLTAYYPAYSRIPNGKKVKRILI